MPTIRTTRHRNYRGPVTDTDIWDVFALRPDDIIVDTPPKCGTTWMLNIVMMLIFGRAVPDAGSRDNAPWLDCAFADRPARAAFLDSLERRRCIKSHTPMDGIPYGPDPTYIVVFRHPVDVHFSLRAHVANMKHDLLDHLFPEDEQAGFSRFLTGPLTEQGTDDLTLASLSRHYLQARAREDGGNVHFFHYADLSRDLRGQIIRLAGILDIQLPDQIIDEIAAATTFTSMRAVIETSDERFGDNVPFHDMAKFYDSGTSNKWKGRLSDKDMAAYAARFAELLPADDIAWFEWGDCRHP